MRMSVGVFLLSLALTANALPTRIVGGEDAAPNKYPYQASLWTGGIQFQCGGSIINDRYILTAAHCVYGYNRRYISVGVGNHLLNETIAGPLLRVDDLITHEDYDYNANNDIALIRLTKKLKYNDKVQPISLPTSNFAQEDDYPVVLSGWGRLRDGGPLPNALQHINLKLFSNERCQKKFSISEKQICTFTKTGEGACRGDSGGALIADGIQIGIVSFGIPCAKGVPDVYTRVYSYLDWIEKNMNLV